MKSISIILLLLVSCGRETVVLKTKPGKDGTSCTTQSTTYGAKITCSDGTYSLLYNGLSGLDGVNGKGCTVTSSNDGVEIICGDEPPVQIANGTSCTTVQLSNGAKIICGNQIAYIYNGLDAPITAFSFVKEITPCGASSSPWKEILLCMTNGKILASFSDSPNGQNTRLANIPTGSYIDTDNSGCNFNVVNESNGDTTVSWIAGSNQFSTWIAESNICEAN